MFLSSKQATVSHYSSIGTVALFLLTVFQHLTMTLLAIINTQPSNMQGEHWIMIANSCQILCLADSRGPEKYSLLRQQYEQMMPEPLQSHPNVCGFYTTYAAFYLFKFRQEEITGVHDVNVLSFISNYKYFFNFSNVNMQVIQWLC